MCLSMAINSMAINNMAINSIASMNITDIGHTCKLFGLLDRRNKL